LCTVHSPYYRYYLNITIEMGKATL